MDFNNRAYIIGVNLSDRQHLPSSEHIFVDVVLVDISNDILNPLLYQLNAQQGGGPELEIIAIEDHAFAMIGEVLAMDKLKRLILLNNNRTVSYKHLIVASGLRQSVLGREHNDQLSAGVLALAEALRVRRNTSEALNLVDWTGMGFNKNIIDHHAKIKTDYDFPIKNVQKIFEPSALSHEKSLDMALGGTEKRLYQLQL